MALTKIKLNTMVTGNLPDANIPDTITIDNAATATALETARTIHGVSFDGTANIDLTEAIQDVVGGMVSSNTETNTAVTYDDTNGKLNFVSTDTNTFRPITAGGNSLGSSETLAFTAGSNVTITESGGAVTIASTDTNTTYSVGDGGLTQNNFTNALKSKLDGIASSANNYSLPLSTSSARGGVKIGYSENGKNYPVELDSEKMYVNVPWTDTNTTYSVGDGGLTQNNFTNTLKSKLDGIETGATADQDLSAYWSTSNLGNWENDNRNFWFSSSTNTGGQGFGLERSDGTFQLQLYGDGTNQGFLTGQWASWDLKKIINGQLNIRVGGNYYDVVHAGNYTSYQVDTNTNFPQTGQTWTLSSGYSVAMGDWGLRNTTPYGYIQFGPANSSHAHIYTDRSNFYFNTNTLYANGNLMWTQGNDGSGSGLDADLLDGNHASAFVRTNTTSVITSGQALQMSPDADGYPKVNMDARTSGDGARIHRWNRNNADSAYLPYYENWYDGDSYQSFGTESNRWVFNQQLHVADAAGNSYFGGSGDEWGRMEFNGYGNGIYVYTNSGDFRVDGGNWNPYSDSDVSLGNSSVRWNGCHIVDWFRVYGGGGVYWNDYGHHIYPNNSTHLYWRSGSTSAVGMLMTTNGTNRGYVYANSSNEMGFLTSGGSWAFQKSTGNTYGTYSVFTGQNSWNGITYSSHSSKPTIMFKDNHGDGGLYHQGSSSWRWYYDQNTGCIGLNGSATNSSYGAYVTGSMYVTGSYGSSDIRFKENIETIDNGLDKVMKMRGVYFDWNDDHKVEKGEGRQVGVIAQEINMVLPEVVMHQDNDEYAVDYSKITGVLIEAIKDLKNEINQLKEGCCHGS